MNSGSQPLSCSIMVFSFNQLPWPHPRSSAWGPDETRSPCPALRFIILHDYNFSCLTKTNQCPCKITDKLTNQYINVIFSSVPKATLVQCNLFSTCLVFSFLPSIQTTNCSKICRVFFFLSFFYETFMLSKGYTVALANRVCTWYKGNVVLI